jgi:hypothetical protein
LAEEISQDVNGTASRTLDQMRANPGQEDAAMAGLTFAGIIGVRARRLKQPDAATAYRELLKFSHAAEEIVSADDPPDANTMVQMFRSIELECALAVEDDAQAKELCRAMLKSNTDSDNWNYGNVIHDANMALAEIDFRRNDFDAAAAELRAAGNGPGSPVLSSFGPSFPLVPKMWRAGRKDAVLAYLQGISKYYEPETVKAWIAKLKSGSVPTDSEWVSHTKD